MKSKRILSMLLCVLMCLTLMPAMSFAAGPQIINKIEFNNLDLSFDDQTTGFEAKSTRMGTYTFPDNAGYFKGNNNIYFYQNGSDVWDKKFAGDEPAIMNIEVYAKKSGDGVPAEGFDFDSDNLNNIEVWINGTKRTDATVKYYNDYWRCVTVSIPIYVDKYGGRMHTVTFDTLGGSAAANQLAKHDGYVLKPSDPTYPGKAFTGWYLDKECTRPVDFFTFKVTSNTTIYAGWEDIVKTQYIQKIEINDLMLEIPDNVNGIDVRYPVMDKLSFSEDSHCEKGNRNVYVYQNDTAVYDETLKAGLPTKMGVEVYAAPFGLNHNNPAWDFDEKNLDKIEIWINGVKRTDAELKFYNDSWRCVTLIIPVTVVKAESDEVTFTDVPDTAYFKDAVKWAVANNITKGISDTEFGPDLACTRAQAVTFLWRAAGSPIVTAEKSFSDVPDTAYYKDAVNWAVKNGITVGMSDTDFGPDLTCTRAQIVTFIYRSAGQPDISVAENPFTDISESDYFYAPVIWAVKNDITKGMSATEFGPGNNCTRAQIVTFIYRI